MFHSQETLRAGSCSCLPPIPPTRLPAHWQVAACWAPPRRAGLFQPHLALSFVSMSGPGRRVLGAMDAPMVVEQQVNAGHLSPGGRSAGACGRGTVAGHPGLVPRSGSSSSTSRHSEALG